MNRNALIFVIIVVASALAGCGTSSVPSGDNRDIQLRTRLIEVETELSLLWQELKDGGLQPAAVLATDPIREKLMTERDQLKKELAARNP